jgi:hypothetical protein
VNQTSAGIPYAIAVAVGMTLWIVATEVSGKREAWDSGIYWTLFYPLSVAAAVGLGYLFPERPWRWALALFLAQFVAMALVSGEIGNLAPLGAVMFVVLSVPAIVVANVVARAKRS